MKEAFFSKFKILSKKMCRNVSQQKKKQNIKIGLFTLVLQ